MDKMTNLLFSQEQEEAHAHEMSGLERQFPRIAEHLVEMWNNAACDEYLNTLVLDDRCDRHGFPPEVMEDLMLLENIRWSLVHDEDLPQLPTHILQYRFSETPVHVALANPPAGSKSWIKRTFGS
jgi:hypothetical protein